MNPIASDAELCLVRSRVRFKVFLALNSLGEAYVGQLARMTRLPWIRVRMALEGAPPDYSEKISIVGAGLARAVPVRNGRVFRITTKGRRKARSMIAAWQRRGSRESVRERVERDVRVNGHPAAAPAPSERPPVPPPTASASTTFVVPAEP